MDPAIPIGIAARRAELPCVGPDGPVVTLAVIRDAKPLVRDGWKIVVGGLKGKERRQRAFPALLESGR